MGEPLPPLPLAMCDTYCRGILRVMVGQVLEKLEFDSVSAASRDTLTDILQAYIEELGHVSRNASELANRTEANAHDVLVAFDDCNLSLQDLRAMKCARFLSGSVAARSLKLQEPLANKRIGSISTPGFRSCPPNTNIGLQRVQICWRVSQTMTQHVVLK